MMHTRYPKIIILSWAIRVHIAILTTAYSYPPRIIRPGVCAIDVYLSF